MRQCDNIWYQLANWHSKYMGYERKIEKIFVEEIVQRVRETKGDMYVLITYSYMYAQDFSALCIFFTAVPDSIQIHSTRTSRNVNK